MTIASSSAGIDAVLADFYAQNQRLFSLVTDPEGKRFFQQKTAEMRRREMAISLRRTAAFLAFAGHPEAQFNAVHIAGTSGKGSVTLMVSALLQALGWRTAHHTSPYLQTPLEKLVCNGQPIRPSAFAQLVRDFFAIHESWEAQGGEFSRLKYGEAWVALTFLWMAQQQVEWGVVETGMGGRFDPTNLVPAQLSIVTNVGWDHEQSLGPSLTDIAWHKAGIIKQQQDVVTGVTEPELLAAVVREAEQQGAHLFALREAFSYQVSEQTMTVYAPFQRYEGLHIPSFSGFQWLNAAVAIAAVDVLAARHGKRLSAELITAALREVKLPGRMEVMQERPLVILDGAHNPPKMQALVNTLLACYPERPITAILGAIVNKDVSKMLEALLPVVKKIIVTEPHVAGKPAQPPEVLQEKIQQLTDSVIVQTAATVHEALALAIAQAQENELILTTGSLYLVGEARSYWYPTEQWLRDLEQL